MLLGLGCDNCGRCANRGRRALGSFTGCYGCSGLGSASGSGSGIVAADVAGKIAQGFNGKRISATAALPLLDNAYQLAKQNAEGEAQAVIDGAPSPQPNVVRQQIEQLQYLIGVCEEKEAAGDSYAWGLGEKMFEDIRAAVLAPYVFRSGQAARSDVLASARRELGATLADILANLPAKVAEKIAAGLFYLPEQVSKGLWAGIPMWVKVGGALALLGAVAKHTGALEGLSRRTRGALR